MFKQALGKRILLFHHSLVMFNANISPIAKPWLIPLTMTRGSSDRGQDCQGYLTVMEVCITQLLKLLHNSPIPSEAVIFLVTNSLCKRDYLIVISEVMAFALSFMFQRERHEEPLIVGCCDNT